MARSCDQLITGTSKAKVTAGLIGGRLGNKGGVGVSLAIAGSRLLFVSAHLAAHASALEIRKANVHKILSELEVDDFLPPGHELKKAANVSDRFDQAIFMGDLNFRLDISRLHADWLTKAHNYTTALEFDQLRKVMKDDGGVFAGFKEAPITFGPTYKYDLPKRVTKRASRILRSPAKAKRSSKDWKHMALAEEPGDTPPQTPASPSPLTAGPSPMIAQDFVGLEGLRSPLADGPLPRQAKARDDDAVSVSSTIASDFSELDHLQLVDAQGSAVDLNNGVEVELPTGPGGSLEKLDLGSPKEREKAKVKFLTLVKANSAAFGRKAAFDAKSGPVKSNSAPAGGGRKHAHSVSGSKLTSALGSRPPLRSSLTEMAVSHVSDDLPSPAVHDVEAEPAFDSSSKQRVQSYTDRILWKSTVPVPEPLPAPTPLGTGSRRGSLFVDTVRAVMAGAGHKPSSSVEAGAPSATAPGLNRSWTTGDTLSGPVPSPVESTDHSVATRLNRLFTRHAPQRSVSMTQPNSPSSFESPPPSQPLSLSPKSSPGLERGEAGPGARPDGARRARSLGQKEPRKLVRRAHSASPAREKDKTMWAPLGLGRPAGPEAPSAADVGWAQAGRKHALVASPGEETATSVASSAMTPPASADTLKAVDFSKHPSNTADAAASLAATDETRRPGSPKNRATGAFSTPATSPANTRAPSANHISFPADVTTVSSRPDFPARHSQPVPEDSTGAGTDRHGFLRGATTFPRSLSSLTTARDHADSAPVSTGAPVSATGASGSGLTRLRSFFHLPALQTIRPLSLFDRADEDGSGLGRRRREGPTGPRKGEVIVLRYDAIADLKKMDAVSDHRPVFLSVAVGVGGGEDEDEGE